MILLQPVPIQFLWGIPVALLAALLAQLLHLRLRPAATGAWIVGHFPLYLGGTLPLFGLFLLFYGLMGNLVVSCAVMLLLVVLMAYSNFLMLRYREQPIVPRDLAMALNLNRLLTMISPASVAALTLGLVAAGGGAFALHRLIPTPVPTPAWRVIVTALGLGIVLLFARTGRQGSIARRFLELCGGRFDVFFRSGNTFRSFQENGFVAAFFSLCGHPLMEKPDGYSREAVERIVAGYAPLAATRRAAQPAQDAKPPHILYIMSEAFSDPMRLPDLRCSEDPIPRLRTVANGCVSGSVLAPGYGGGTAHCEFEALTGFSVALTGGISPFENNVHRHKEFPAVPRRLLSQGYHTLALHPYKRGMYARTEAYPAMGLQRFLDVTAMRHTAKPDNNPYVSDAAAYDEVWELLLAADSPLFLHLVTMQNHGDYTQKNRFAGGPTVAGLPLERDNRAVETYIRGLCHTDNATADFLELLQNWGERVVVVFWGDHLPGVYPADFIADKNRLRYETPFFLWTNFSAAPDQLGTRSPMMLPSLLAEAAGLPATGYDMLLEALQQELRGIHERFLVDARDRMCSPDSLTPEAAARLEELRLIQYDAMLGGQYAGTAGFFV